MQSRKMKKAQDYEIGEHVREDGFDAGRVVAVLNHPDNDAVSYLLLTNSSNEFSMYRGLNDCNAGLALARNIPESVAMQFAEVMLGREAPPVVKSKKYPVVSDAEAPVEADEVVEVPSIVGETKAPYFDFM